MRALMIAASVLACACAATAQENTEQAPSRFTQAVRTAPPAEAPPEAPGNPPTVFAWDEMQFAPTDVGARVQITDEPTRTLDTLEIHITTLNPGQTSHAPHRHANEEVIVLHQGRLRVYVNGETKEIGPGSMMVFLSNDWHSVNNIGDTPATYHVINYRSGRE